MKRMLIGMVLMFFGYSTGIFEWHLLVVLSNIFGVCIFYSGYLSTAFLRKFHFSYPLSMYGLANLLLLALSLNELKLKDFVFDNPLTFLLAFFSFVFTIAVVYFPAILLYKMARVIDKEKKLGLESQLSFIKWMGGALIISMTFFQMTHPFVLDLVVSIYVVFHYVIIGYLARKWLNHPILLAENISKEVLEEK